jgi:hypothetical protein
VRTFSLALKFALELAAFAAFAYWGASVNIAVAIAAPALAIVLWGIFAAPRSNRRLPLAPRVGFEASVFALAVVALLVAGAPIAALVMAILSAASFALLARFDQLEA